MRRRGGRCGDVAGDHSALWSPRSRMWPRCRWSSTHCSEPLGRSHQHRARQRPHLLRRPSRRQRRGARDDGIGLVNAAETATAAFEHFRCPFRGAVFSGVAGSKSFIGDVNVPSRWTEDTGNSWSGPTPRCCRRFTRCKARTRSSSRRTSRSAMPRACVPVVNGTLPVHLPYVPQLRVGGSGTSADMFGGDAVPCLPGGGDIAGCAPCLAPGELTHRCRQLRGEHAGARRSGFHRGVPPTT